MRSIPAPVIALLDVGQITHHVAYLMQTEDSPSDGAAWSGAGPLTIDGIVYTGLLAPSLAQQITHEIGVGVNGVSVTLSSNDPFIITQIVGQDLRGRWLTIKDLFCNVQGTVVLHAEDVFFGTINEVNTQDTPGDPGEAAVVIRAVGEAQGLERGLGRLMADQDQRIIDLTDTGARRTAAAPNAVLTWGGSAPRRAEVALKD